MEGMDVVEFRLLIWSCQKRKLLSPYYSVSILTSDSAFFRYYLLPGGHPVVISFSITLQSPDKSEHSFEFLPKIRRMRFYVYNKGDDQGDEKQRIIRIGPEFLDNRIVFKALRRNCRRRMNNIYCIRSHLFNHWNDEFL